MIKSVYNLPRGDIVDSPPCYIIKTAWDNEARTWIAVSDDIPLATESDSYETLLERVKSIAPEIIELNYGFTSPVNLLFKKGVLTADGFL